MTQTKSWRDLPLWKRVDSKYESGKYSMVKVNNLTEKARVYREYQYTRIMPHGEYSVYGFKLCHYSEESPAAFANPDHKVVHPFSVDVYYLTDDGTLEKTYDATERYAFIEAMMLATPLNSRLSPFYCHIDWDGIEAEASREVAVKIRPRGPRVSL